MAKQTRWPFSTIRLKILEHKKNCVVFRLVHGGLLVLPTGVEWQGGAQPTRSWLHCGSKPVRWRCRAFLTCEKSAIQTIKDSLSCATQRCRSGRNRRIFESESTWVAGPTCTNLKSGISPFLSVDLLSSLPTSYGEPGLQLAGAGKGRSWRRKC
jgi:hypothetical protein